MFLYELFFFGLDGQGLINVRPDKDGGHGAEGGSDPVDHKVLGRRVPSATELQGGGQDRVEVPAAGGEGKANHGRGNEAVDGGGVLRLALGNDARSQTADQGGDSLDDRAVEDGHGEISRADVVYGGVGPAHMGFSNLQLPQQLDHPRID